MTRKQGLQKCYEILKNQHDNQDGEIGEILKILKDVINSMPITRWDVDTILDVVENWIIENNGKVPTPKDFKKHGLPPSPTIKRVFGLNTKDFLEKYFLDKYYPNRVRGLRDTYLYKTKDEYIKDFIECYYNNKPTSAKSYNLLRSKNLPRWEQLAEMIGISTWNELLDFCKIDKNILIKKQEFIVNSHNDIDDKMNKLEK